MAAILTIASRKKIAAIALLHCAPPGALLPV
jgi:hypothetical protein